MMKAAAAEFIRSIVDQEPFRRDHAALASLTDEQVKKLEKKKVV